MCKVIPANLLAPTPGQSAAQEEQLAKIEQARKELAKEHLLKVQIALARQCFGSSGSSGRNS